MPFHSTSQFQKSLKAEVSNLLQKFCKNKRGEHASVLMLRCRMPGLAAAAVCQGGGKQVKDVQILAQARRPHRNSSYYMRKLRELQGETGGKERM